MADFASKKWLYALIAGTLAALLFGVMAGITPEGAATMPKSYGGSVMALEFARTMPDLRAIFGSGDDPSQIARIALMRLATWHDMGFAPLYALFLSFAALALLEVTSWRALYLVPLLVASAALFDLVENWMMLQILETFRSGGYDPMLARLGWPVWAKFLFLGLAGTILGLGLTGLPGLWRLLGFIVAAVALPLCLLAWLMPYWLAGAMAAGIGLGWLVLFAASAYGSFAWWRTR